MASQVSKYFNRYDHSNTQKLVEDLIIQQIKLIGTTIYYISKDLAVSEHDTLMREPNLLIYNSSVVDIECLVTEATGTNGFGNSFSFFGMEMGEKIVLAISKRRFKEEFKIHRPVESDLIYFPQNNTLYEIISVNEDSEFLKHGRNFIWTVTLNVYSPSTSSNINEVDISDIIPNIQHIINNQIHDTPLPEYNNHIDVPDLNDDTTDLTITTIMDNNYG